MRLLGQRQRNLLLTVRLMVTLVSLHPSPRGPAAPVLWGGGDSRHAAALHQSQGTPDSGNLIWAGQGGALAVNTPAQPLPRKETLSLLYCMTNTSSLCPRGKHFIFQSCLQPVSWRRHSRTKALSASVHKTRERPVEDPSPQGASILFKLPLVPICYQPLNGNSHRFFQ